MNIFKISLAILLVAASAPVSRLGAIDSDESTEPTSAEALAEFKQRWKLQLLPEKLPGMGLHLMGTTWGQHSLRDILGRGIDRFIAVTANEALPANHEIVFTTIQHYSVNVQKPKTETKQRFPVTIASPFLEYDGLIHTVFMSPDRKKFIPDAILRVADRKWYQATSRRLADENGAPGVVEVTENLFEFENDPVRTPRGTLTLHRQIRKANAPTGETTRTPTTFVLFRHLGEDSQPYEVQIGIPGNRSLTVFFYAGQDFAIPEGDVAPATRIYSLEETE